MNLEQTFSSGRFWLQRPGRAPGSAPHHSPASEQKRAPAHGRLCCNCNRPNPDPNRPFVCWACAFVQWVLPNLAREISPEPTWKAPSGGQDRAQNQKESSECQASSQ